MSDERWLAAAWPFVQANLPAPPSRVVELGCGTLGGFVPRLRAAGYDATGVDPKAPDGPEYDQSEFEDAQIAQPLDALVASASMHHVADLDLVLDRIRSLLRTAGSVVVIEWAHERFDEPTARWCFYRLQAAGDHSSWLHVHRDAWLQSGLTWDAYFQAWLREEPLHPGRVIVSGLEARFETQDVSEVPHLFADLDGISRADEQDAIDSGLIRANGIHYVGRNRSGASERGRSG